MTLGEMMDLMNRDYDRNDPKFLKEVQLSVYSQAHTMGRADIIEKVRDNIVANPETIGLNKEDKSLDGMEQQMSFIENEYSNQNTEARIR